MAFAASGARVHERTRLIYGETASLVAVTRGSYTPGSGTVAESTVTLSVLGVAGEYQVRDRNGSLLTQEETFCVCSDVLAGVEPKQGDRLTRAGKTTEVTRVSIEIYGSFVAFTLYLASV